MPHRPTAAAQSARQLALTPAPRRGTTEAQLLEAVRKLARLTGWTTYHTHDSRRSEPGFPDLVLASLRKPRIIFAELKTDTGRLRPEQHAWLARLAAAGMEVALWRPRDLTWDIPAILKGRPCDPWNPDPPHDPVPVGDVIPDVIDHLDQTTRHHDEEPHQWGGRQ